MRDGGLLAFVQREIEENDKVEARGRNNNCNYGEIVGFVRDRTLVTTFKTGNTWLIHNHVESYSIANLDLLHRYFCRHLPWKVSSFCLCICVCLYIYLYMYVHTHRRACTRARIQTSIYEYGSKLSMRIR